MKIKDVAIEVSKREGKKTNQNIAEISEMLAVVSDIVASCPEALAVLITNGVRRAKKRGLLAFMVVAVGFLAQWCASLPGIKTDQGAAGIAQSLGKPEYAASIEKVADLLVGKRVNPVAGFTRQERWDLKGAEINPNDLKLEVLYRNAFQVNPAMMTSSPS